MNSFKIRNVRTIGDVLGDTFKYIREYYKSLLKMTAIFVLGPVMLGSVLLVFEMSDIFLMGMVEFDPASQQQLFQSGISIFIAFMLVFAGYGLLFGVVFQHMRHAVEGEVPMLASDFSKGMFGRIIRMILVFILLSFLFFVAFMVTIIFAAQTSLWILAAVVPLFIFLVIKLMLFPVAFFVEDAGAFNSLARSWELTNGYFWQTFGVYLLITIVFGILSNLLGTPLVLLGTIVGAGVGGDTAWFETLMIVFYSFSFVFQILFFGAQNIAIGLQYFNLEERKEGHTLSEQIQELEKGLA